MGLEEKIKQQLLNRGFTKEQLLNNRGLIGATIDEVTLAIVKNLNIHDVIKSICVHCGTDKGIKVIDGSYWCKKCRTGW
jgi:hypothetical protein